MKYHILAHANLRHYLPQQIENFEFDHTEQLNIYQLLDVLCIPRYEVMCFRANGEMVEGTFLPNENVIIELYPVLAGG